MRVVIYGGRDWNDQDQMNLILDKLHEERQFTEFINGGALGVDSQAVAWARVRGVRITYFHALWSLHGKAAGPIRNRRMVVEGKPELGIQFPGGNGTNNMRDQMDKAGIEVIDVASLSDGGATQQDRVASLRNQRELEVKDALTTASKSSRLFRTEELDL